MIYVAIDLETGGLDPMNNDILEFGAVLEDTENQVPLDQLPSLRLILKPKLGYYRMEPIAAAMNADLLKEIGELAKGKFGKTAYIDPSDLGVSFGDWLHVNGVEYKDKKYHINVAGKNFSSFDRRFLDQLEDFNLLIDIRHRVLDPTMYYVKSGDLVCPNLPVCMNRAGLEPNGLHTAIGDCLMVVALIRKGMKDHG